MRTPLGEASTTFTAALRIIGEAHGAEESPVIRSKFAAPKKIPETFVVSVQGGYSTHLGMNLSADGRLITDVSYETTLPASNLSERDHSLWPNEHSVRFPVRTHRAKSSVITLTSRWQWNYFHWLFDVIPRVHLARMAGLEAAEYYVEYTHSFQKDSLALLGIRAGAIIDATSNPIIQATTLVIPSYPEAPMGIPPWACTFLRSSLLVECQNRASHFDHSQGKRIYLSRRDASSRLLTNENELIELLMRYGFEVLELSQLSIAQQILAFAKADAIIGPHGAGFANLVFCKRGTTVIEISPPKFIFGYYHDLATRCDLEHYMVFGKGADLRHDYGWMHKPDDYSVDLALVREAVNKCA